VLSFSLRSPLTEPPDVGYGREMIGYEVADIADTLSEAKAAGATVLVDPYTADRRQAAIVSFSGGYIAEIHSAANK
jgi:hypothetical protein